MQKRRKNRLLLFKNGEVKMRKIIKIFILIYLITYTKIQYSNKERRCYYVDRDKENKNSLF